MNRLVLSALILSLALSMTRASVASADFEVRNFRLSTERAGPVTTAFPTGITEIYANFDYVDATDVPIQLKVYDPVGQVLYLETLTYEGSGSESIQIANSGFPFTDGIYLINMYTGKLVPQTGGGDLYIYQSIEWTVGQASIPESGSGEVIATVVVQGSTGTAGSGTSSFTVAGLAIALIILVVVVGWAVRGVVTSRP